MSHFTNIKTRFQNLFYLEKALNRLNINHQKKEEIISKLNKESINIDLVIPQSNGSDIKFCWNGQEYQLVVDLSYWVQPYPLENFIDKVAQQYAGEVIVGESRELGFQPIQYKENQDGSNTLVLERWKNNII